MECEDRDFGQDLLNINLEAVVAEGKKRDKRKGKVLAIIIIVVAIVGMVILASQMAKKKAVAYQEALTIQASGGYEEAGKMFEGLGNYKDSAQMAQECYDKQTLKSLQTLYNSINTVYQGDDALLGTVDTVLSNVDAVNGAPLMRASSDVALAKLYNGKGYEISTSCSLYDAARIQAAISSVQIYGGGERGYTASATILREGDARNFAYLLSKMETLLNDAEPLASVESKSKKYQEVQNRLQLAYEAIKEYHSFVANLSDDYTEYETKAPPKKMAVNDLLAECKRLAPEICGTAQ